MKSSVLSYTIGAVILTIFAGYSANAAPAASKPLLIGPLQLLLFTADGTPARTYPAPCSTTSTNTVGMQFNRLPPGSFVMGSPVTELGRSADEKEHSVRLSGFSIQTKEITKAQWEAVMGGGTDPSSGLDNCVDDNTCPVTDVSWYDAVGFANALSTAEGKTPCYNLSACSGTVGVNFTCTSVGINSSCTGYSLPTEAQWEYAARATTSTAFYNGAITNTACNDPKLKLIGWYCGNANNTTHAVAQKTANSWCLYDMSGNVEEWTQDWYGTYPTAVELDPDGSATGTKRVYRGGSFLSNASHGRSAYRNSATPDSLGSNVGLRLVRP